MKTMNRSLENFSSALLLFCSGSRDGLHVLLCFNLAGCIKDKELARETKKLHTKDVH